MPGLVNSCCDGNPCSNHYYLSITASCSEGGVSLDHRARGSLEGKLNDIKDCHNRNRLSLLINTGQEGLTGLNMTSKIVSNI